MRRKEVDEEENSAPFYTRTANTSNHTREEREMGCKIKYPMAHVHSAATALHPISRSEAYVFQSA